MITDQRGRERKRLQRMLGVLEETLEHLNEAHGEILTDRVMDAFGTDYVDGDDLRSIGQEPELQRIADVLAGLERRIAGIKSKLADDGSDPPF